MLAYFSFECHGVGKLQCPFSFSRVKGGLISESFSHKKNTEGPLPMLFFKILEKHPCKQRIDLVLNESTKINRVI